MQKIYKELSTYLLNSESYTEQERKRIRKYLREKLDKYVDAVSYLNDL
ncbi:hypothetical protein [Flagellimonas sp.]